MAHLTICAKLVCILGKNSVSLPYICLLANRNLTVCTACEVESAINLNEAYHSRTTHCIVVKCAVLLYDAVEHLTIFTELTVCIIKSNTVILPYIRYLVNCNFTLSTASEVVIAIDVDKASHLRTTHYIVVKNAILLNDTIEHLTVCAKLTVRVLQSNTVILPDVCYLANSNFTVSTACKVVVAINFNKTCHLGLAVLVVVKNTILFYDTIKHLAV